MRRYPETFAKHEKRLGKNVLKIAGEYSEFAENAERTFVFFRRAQQITILAREYEKRYESVRLNAAEK